MPKEKALLQKCDIEITKPWTLLEIVAEIIRAEQVWSEIKSEKSIAIAKTMICKKSTKTIKLVLKLFKNTFLWRLPCFSNLM